MNPGDKVTVTLFNGRVLQGVIKRIEETVAGRKIVVSSGDLVLKVNPEQVKVGQ